MLKKIFAKYVGPKFNEKGEEIMDPKPMAVPIGFKRPETLQEQIRRLIRSEQLAHYARSTDRETFEEADDFEVGDDFDPTSPYEEKFDPVDPPEVLEKLKGSPPSPASSGPAKGRSRRFTEEVPMDRDRDDDDAEDSPPAPRQKNSKKID